MTAIYLTFVGLTAVLAVTAIYHAPKWRKLMAYIMFVCLLIGAPLVYFDTLARPKNLSDEIRHAEEAQVLAYHSQDGVAVYYWLLLPNLREPRYYYEPWSEEARKRVGELQQQFEGDGPVFFTLPFEPSLEKERKIHPLPQLKREIKPQPPQGRVPQYKA